MTRAIAVDNRVNRLASVLDSVRPFVAIKPKGYLNRVIGHYSSMGSARRAARRFNETIGA